MKKGDRNRAKRPAPAWHMSHVDMGEACQEDGVSCGHIIAAIQALLARREAVADVPHSQAMTDADVESALAAFRAERAVLVSVCAHNILNPGGAIDLASEARDPTARVLAREAAALGGHEPIVITSRILPESSALFVGPKS